MEIKDIQSLIEENKRLTAQLEKLSLQKAELEQEKSSLEKDKAALQNANAELEAANASLKSMMEWMRRKLFGKMSEKEQAKLDAEVKAMEEQNAKTIEVKSHRREVRKPICSNPPVVVTDIYPKGMKDNPDYVEIGVETTDRIAIKPAQM